MTIDMTSEATCSMYMSTLLRLLLRVLKQPIKTLKYYIVKHQKVLLGGLTLCSLFVFFGLNKYKFSLESLIVPGVPDPVKYIIDLIIQKSVYIPANCPALARDNNIKKFTLEDGKQERYFVSFNRKTPCLRDGTNSSHVTHTVDCICNSGWYGKHCSVPRSIKTPSLPFSVHQLQIRPIPRRILIFFGFSHEFDILEIRLRETYDLVDAFVILESNYTKFGEPKPQYLLQKMNSGYLREFQDKIVYVFLDHILEKNHKSWKTEMLCRRYLGCEGIKRIKNLHDGDIIMFQDADEIPSRETLLFLKLHDGYSEPIGFSLRWSVYGFYWKNAKTTDVFAAATARTMRMVHWDLHSLRRGPDVLKKVFQTLKSLNKGVQRIKGPEILPLKSWMIGNASTSAGWHCSWCFSPEGISRKLASAVNADFPRWGDYPEKRNLTYIKSLIRRCLWFSNDPLYPGQRITTPYRDNLYAPKYAMDNYEKYLYLLSNPFITENDDIQNYKENQKILTWFRMHKNRTKTIRT